MIQMTLLRNERCENGIFGELWLGNMTAVPLAYTLEHAYGPGPAYSPKLPAGIYACVRGIHRLTHGNAFETFEITGVPGHRGVLFHVGNVNEDSEGCVLLGTEKLWDCIRGSRDAFKWFMSNLTGIDEFELEVRD